MSAYELAFLIVESKLDLSYSLLIFMLESLAQHQSRPHLVPWTDFPDHQRQALDKYFRERNIDDATASGIRDILRTDTNSRALRRFKDFVTAYIPDDFFRASAHQQNRRQIRRSRIEPMLQSAYKIRSEYVHELTPLAETIRLSQKYETCHFNKEDHFTLRGLHRLCREVLLNFVSQRSPAELTAGSATLAEFESDFPGKQQLPSHQCTDYWINKCMPKDDGSDVLAWIEGLLEMHTVKCIRKKPVTLLGIGPDGLGVLSFLPGTKYPFQELQAWADKGLHHTKSQHRESVLALAALCGSKTVAKFKKPTRIESLVADVFSTVPTLDTETATNILRNHLRQQSSKQLKISTEIEIALMLHVSQKHQKSGGSDQAREWWKAACDDAAGLPDIQSKLLESDGNFELLPKVSDILFPDTAPEKHCLLFDHSE
jgi:hypothetical protein